MPDFERINDLPILPPRARDAHKGDFGRVLVVAGSLGMSGAAVLCGSAALRGGAGLVQIAVPDTVQPVVASGQICATTAALPATESGQFAAHALPDLLNLAKRADVLAIGPGLGAGQSISHVVRGLLEQTELPVALDADGLNAIAPLRPGERLRDSPTVLTPHPGEFARLAGTTTADVQANREACAVHFAAEFAVVLVLKGAGTLVADGRRLYLNRTGNPGMATGGTGDVLTGLIAALIAQGLLPFDAACLGTYLHGLAGDLACDQLGEEALLATDLLANLPAAFAKYRTG